MNTNTTVPATAPYKVGTLRAAGLQSKWGKTSAGAPIIFARAKAGSWYAVDKTMWAAMQREGVQPAFERFTLLGSYFSIPA